MKTTEPRTRGAGIPEKGTVSKCTRTVFTVSGGDRRRGRSACVRQDVVLVQNGKGGLRDKVTCDLRVE